MLDEALVARARARLQQPAFEKAAARLRRELREDLARPVLVPQPDRPAGYYHDYFCPQHGVQLEFDGDSPLAHRCPVDGAVFRGEPYDRAWWWFVNHAHSEAGFRLALGWRLLDDAACLARLRDILAAYAAHYPEAGWPQDDPRSRQGKVTFHALDEAAWLIPLAWAYHLVRDALPAGTRHEVEARLLLPAAEHLARQRWSQVHNYMCWLNAGVAAAATLVGRDDLVAQAIDGPYGFRQQVAEGVLADGTWWEGSASYHFYTLAALLALVRSVEGLPAGQGGAGTSRSLQRHPKLRRMFLAPLRWAYPDLSLPAINDCWYHSSLVGEVGHGIPAAAPFYELAAGWYGDPAFAAILAANYRPGPSRPAGPSPRDSAEALLFGPESVPAFSSRTPRPLAASANLPDFGVAVLRGPAGGRSTEAGAAAGAAGAEGAEAAGGGDRRTFVLLKYGRHGGGHGHPDKLGIIVAGGGARLSPDLGTPGYGIALHQAWYRHTLSHNTVLIDGRPQPPATGRLLAFSPPTWRHRAATGREDRSADNGGAFGLIDAAVEWPADAHDAVLGATRDTRRAPSGAPSEALGSYDGVRLRRLIILRRGYFVDVFTVVCPDARQIEWTYHNLGRLAALRPVTTDRSSGAAAPELPPLAEPLRCTHAAHGDQAVRATFSAGQAGLDLWLNAIDVPGAVVIAAEAPANPASETMALILRRCHAASALFAAVFHPYRGGPGVTSVAWSCAGGALRCDVQLRTSSDRWTIPLSENGTIAGPPLLHQARAR